MRAPRGCSVSHSTRTPLPQSNWKEKERKNNAKFSGHYVRPRTHTVLAQCACTTFAPKDIPCLLFSKSSYFSSGSRVTPLPTCLETGRYKRPRMPEELRQFQMFSDRDLVEDEDNFLFNCPCYEDFQQGWLAKIKVPADLPHIPLASRAELM